MASGVYTHANTHTHTVAGESDYEKSARRPHSGAPGLKSWYISVATLDSMVVLSYFSHLAVCVI